MNEDPVYSHELKKFHIYVLNDKETQYEGILTDELYEEFELLFEKGDGKALQFEELVDPEINTVLLDCLMYDDDLLFASALALLEKCYTQRRQFLECLSKTILMPFAELPVFGQVDVMMAEINYLGYLATQYPVWGVSSKLSGSFNEKMISTFKDTNEKILEFLHSESFKEDTTAERRNSVRKSSWMLKSHSKISLL
jgi:hypothetical protein